MSETLVNYTSFTRVSDNIIKSPIDRGLLSVYIDEQTTPKCATIKCKYIIIYLTNCINNFVKKLKYKKL